MKKKRTLQQNPSAQSDDLQQNRCNGAECAQRRQLSTKEGKTNVRIRQQQQRNNNKNNNNNNNSTQQTATLRFPGASKASERGHAPTHFAAFVPEHPAQ
jgi:hypothetical protein